MRTTGQSSYLWLTRLAVGLLLSGPATAQTLSSLTVKAATSKRTDLAWSGTAASYAVQRRILGGSYSTIANVSNSTYSDTQLDAFTAYEYQVTAGTATSNAVRVGPPPA